MARIRTAPALLLATLLAACSGDVFLFWRQANPPPLAHLSRQEVRSTMGELARSVKQLNELLRSKDRDDHRDEMARILAELDELADRLEPEDHPGSDPDLDALHETIRRARLAVEVDPANYRTIEKVPYACVYCHAPPSLEDRDVV